MFGIGFTELLMIAIVAILFLGPDKLPDAMVQIGKFIRQVKRTLDEARSSFEEEVNLNELREETLSYTQSLREAQADIQGFKNALPNPVEEVREAFEGAKLEEDDFELDPDWDDDRDEWADEEEPAGAKRSESSQKRSEANAERPTTFKHLRNG
ncbi:Sec-independent protein translocase protein TatB [Nitratifractor sp.]